MILLDSQGLCSDKKAKGLSAHEGSFALETLRRLFFMEGWS